MYIEKINKFLPNHQNINKDDFILILNKSNKENFDIFKLEKDFLLTMLLIKFWEKYNDLIFKWWTCLNKTYFPYFRLSEDLDFVINTDIFRNQRKKLLKEYENNIESDLSILWLKLQEWRKKFDEYKLAMFKFEYKSILDNSIQTIKIDISLKASLRLKPISKNINSIYKDLVFEEQIFNNHTINCIDLKEAVAEKIRAWLTRKTPVIRDFFDIRYIQNNSDFNFKDKELKQLVLQKLKEVNFEYSLDKWDNYNLLQKQVKTDLIPVLNSSFDFDLKTIYDFILTFKPSPNA